MTDIVCRLRKVKAEAWIDGGPPEFYPDPLSQEAADEIERLRRQLKAEEYGHQQCHNELVGAEKNLAEAEAYLHGYRMADKMTGRESSMDAEIDAWLARRSET